ncbi:hypothetical protein ACFWC6_32205 [Micromonospora chalcea]
MSLAGYRQSIADALSTAPDVTGYPYRPTVPKPGDAWPRLTGMDLAGGLVFEKSWSVLVVLPQDERAASDWTDAHYEALVDALLPVGFVDRIEPVLIEASGSNQYALQFTMRS